jgi:polysaccharide biosynthesis protein PslH
VRVLHLTPELPYWPGGSGGSTRQFHLLRKLAELGHEVAVVAPVAPGQRDRVGDLERAGVRLVAHRRPDSRVRETAGVLRRAPGLLPAALTRPVLAWQVSIFWHELRALARPLIQELQPDVISVEHDQAAEWAPALAPHVPSVLVLENLGWEYYESRANAARWPARAALRAEAARFRRFDGRLLPCYGRLIAMSDADARALDFAGVPVSVVPNGVDVNALAPQPPADGPPTLVFTGTMAYPPNAEAIRWFVADVLPRIRREQPDVKLLIVGRDPPPAVRQLARDASVEVTGAVPDVAPWLARATAVVVPVLSGGGTRLKVLEAMAAQRAVVSTTLGAGGIEVEPGRHALIADGAEEFGAGTLRLLHDAELRERLAREGRRLVEGRYGWDALGDAFEAVLRDVASRARRPG